MYLSLSLGLVASACGVQLNEQMPGSNVDAQPGIDAAPGGVDAAPADGPVTPPLPTGPFGAPTKVSVISTAGGNEDDATLNADETEMIFAINVNNKDLYTSKRANAQAAWGAPVALSVLNGAGSDSAARLSADGLTIYYGSERGNSEDIYFSTRANAAAAWGAPQLMPAVNSTTGDDRWYNPCGGGYVLVSDRLNQGDYDLYEGTNGQAPVRLAISTMVQDDLSPFLTADCLIMYWHHDGDLYKATRTAVGQQWMAAGKATDLSRDGSSEQDPWMSADRRRIYYTSDRDGTWDVFMATRSQ